MLGKRIFLFLVGCIGTRTALAYVAYKLAYTKWLPIMGYFALIPAIGFLIIWTFGLRKSGPETFGKAIWWDDLRPVHGLMYLLFFVLSISSQPIAWIVLAVDVFIGLSAWIHMVRNI